MAPRQKKKAAPAHKAASKKPSGAAKGKAARAPSDPPGLKAGEVIVRMYRQGLGDCFLLFFRRSNGKPFTMMIDCGVIAGTAEPETRMRAVVQNIIASTGGFVDVLVVTHEHWDHVSGFTQAGELFAKKPIKGKLAAGQIWLAWTEDDSDATAKVLQGGLKNLLAKVRKAGGGLKKLAADAKGLGIDSENAEQLVNGYGEVLAFFGLESDEAFAAAKDGEGGGKTRTALEAAADLADIRYFAPGEKPWSSTELPDVRIFTLGPPKSPEALRRTNPGAQGYHLAFAESDPFTAALDSLGGGAAADAGKPFDDNWGLSMPGLEPRHAPNSWIGFIQQHYLAESATEDIHRDFQGRRLAGSMPFDQSWRRIDGDWANEAAQFALQLDAYTNNTSLVLAIELSENGPVLLFVGDAQAGNWLSWADLSWQVDGRTVTAKDLLARTCFYKVGHHGSHNATLKGLGLELMTRNDIVAFVPVDRGTARKKRWMRMPLPSIMEKLEEMTRHRVVLSELELPEKEQAYKHQGFDKEFEENDLYFQVRLPTH